MALTRNQLRNFYEDRLPYMEAIIGKEWKEHPPIIESILNVKTAKSGWIDTATVGGMGLFSSAVELEESTEDNPIQGPTARTQVITYAKRSKVSKEAIEDDQGDGIIASRMPMMAKAGRATVEVLGHDIFNSAFGDTVTPDGVSLINAAHVLLDGSTASNLVTGDLSQTTLQTAITTMKNQTDDRGIPIMQMPKVLLVHPDNEWNATVILGTPNVVASANNDINPMSAQGLQLVVSPYLTDSDAFFLLSDDHMLNWYWRSRPSNWSEPDYQHRALEIGMEFRAAQNAEDWRGIVGSAGA